MDRTRSLLFDVNLGEQGVFWKLLIAGLLTNIAMMRGGGPLLAQTYVSFVVKLTLPGIAFGRSNWI